MTYRPRILDRTLDELFPHLTAIAIEGAKGVGKTATGSQHASTIVSLENGARRAAIAADPDLITTFEPPLLIDEWQLLPTVWDRVRRAVDDGPGGARYLLAGSASPPPEARLHSGAGRIVRLVMRPMTFAERVPLDSEISLAALMSGNAGDVRGSTSVTVRDYADEVVRSGFPGIRDLPARARRIQLDSYVDRAVDRDLDDAGIRIREPAALRAWLTAYGAATSSDASYTAILDAATPGESDKPTRQTVARYREHLSRTFILDPVPAWVPSFTPLKRLAKAPKHHLVDPALAARVVGVDVPGLLRGDGQLFAAPAATWLGALFESLVTQSVRVYAEAADGRVSHLRTQNGDHEIDVIIEGPDLGVVAIEVKLAGEVDDRDVAHLNWLKGRIGDRLVERIVINTGPHAYRRNDGVAVIPLALLNP
ncbi:ATP-binding protein [Tsukamurella tyrosinosolvens]|uniref:ATP-binding protein n=1 Tax=Tsukamurella tyrosinosolvens TaxID=57704 RepID=UPI002DD42350|nr:DUF4143 domain-containing protein [Tsukamurella tyrosinosolvens]MEC4612228.1 DUF4143 domain-containing protein [Tsukamurella tyrosinosolvens]